jgi:hypothetical protein
MAIGTITKQAQLGGQTLEAVQVARISFAGDSAYPTGGTVTFAAKVAAALKLEGVDVVGVHPAGACGGYSPLYDAVADKLMVRRTGAINAANEEVPNATDLSATTFVLWVHYR